MNYLKCLACRIRDRIDPDSPVRGRPGRDRTTASRGPEAEEPDRRDQPAAGRLGRQEARQARLRPARTNQRRHLRPDARRGSVRLRPGQPIQHLCHLGDHQRVQRDTTGGKGAAAIGRFALYEDSLAVPDPASDEHEREEAQDQARAAVERLARSARQAGAADPREPIRDRRRPRTDAASRSAGTWGSARSASARSWHAPRPSSGDSPASRRSSHARSDTGQGSIYL